MSLLLAVLAFSSPSADAETRTPITIVLDYVVEPGCPSEAEFVARVERDLGTSLVIDPQADLTIRVRVTSSGRSLSLAFEVADREGTTEASALDDLHCESLVGAAALRTSLALAPLTATQSTVSLPRAAPEQPEAARHCDDEPTSVAAPMVCPSAAVVPPPRPSVRREAGRVWARVAGGAEFFGAGLHGLVAAAVVVRVGPVHLDLRGSYAAPTRYGLSNMPTAGVTLQLGWITSSACLRMHRGRLAIPLCAGLEVGAVRARGFGITRPETSHASWVAVPVRSGLIGAVSDRWALFVEAEAAPLLVRPGVRVHGLPTGYRAGAISARLWGGVEVRLGPSSPASHRETTGRIRTR